MNLITEVTRRNIFDVIIIEGINWSGRLEESDFLCRIFNLSALESNDSRFSDMAGDIRQHRVNNPGDWTDDWVFTDARINLLYCDDALFLQFLCEMLHPVVRADLAEVHKLKQLFNECLAGDRFELVEKAFISEKPIFSARHKTVIDIAVKARTSEILVTLTGDYVSNQITLMESCIESNPHIAIGTAKELVETCCKAILNGREIIVDKNWDLPKLLAETNKLLKLSPKDIPDEARAVKTIRSILGSLSVVVQGICELRNEYGSGHGRDSEFKGLSPRHARLAVGAASTLAVFLLETHEIRE